MESSGISKPILGGIEPAILETYQAIRYSKMAQSTFRPAQVVDIPALKEALSTWQDKLIKFRVHYYIQDQNSPLPGSISASLFQTLLKYERPFTFEIVCKNEAYEVLDITFTTEFLSVFFSDGRILSLLKLASIIELYSRSKQNITQTFSGGTNLSSVPTTFLLRPIAYGRPAVSNLEQPPELVDLWVSLLREKWSEFYHEVGDRQCSLDYFTGTQYDIRRKFTTGRPAVFTDPTDLTMLQELQVVSIIPNCHPVDISQRPLAIEAIIDLDPSHAITDGQKILVANALSEFLLQRGFKFKKRLSGGTHKGFHYIIDIKTSTPLDLITNIAAPQNYFYSKPEKIIINSVRESIIALLLNFLKTYKSDNLHTFTSFESYPDKLCLDVTRTVLHGGKRALYSMHKGTTSIVLPLPYNEPLTEKLLLEYSSLAELDHAFNNAESIHERQVTSAEITKNTSILDYLNQEHKQLWKAYCLSPHKQLFLTKL